MLEPQPGRAELYTQLHLGNPGDVAHYLRICSGARQVLELGSGGGRITFSLAEQGVEVTGIELDHDLLAAARGDAARLPAPVRERVVLAEGDMREMRLGRLFDRILLPYNGLYCLGGERQVLTCFERVAAHLAPGGEFWLDAYVIDAFHAEAPDDDVPEPGAAPPSEEDPVAEVQVGGRTLLVFEESRWTRASQKVEVSYRFVHQGREVARQTLDHHYLLAPQIVLLLDEAGLEVTHCFGGFAGEPYGEDSEFLVLGARKYAATEDEPFRPA